MNSEKKKEKSTFKKTLIGSIIFNLSHTPLLPIMGLSVYITSYIHLKQKNEIFEKIKEIINLDIKRFVQVQPKIRIVSMKIIDLLEKCDNDYNFHVILDFIPRDKNNISFMIYDEKEFEEYSFNNYDYILNVTIYTNNKIN